MYNLKEYSDIYSKTSGSLWQYHRDEPFLNNHGDIVDFPADINDSASFEFKTKIAGRLGNNGRKDVKIKVPLEYLSNVWRTLEIPSISCEINLILAWYDRCFIIDNSIAGQVPTFTITDIKLNVSVVNLSTRHNGKLLQ